MKRYDYEANKHRLVDRQGRRLLMAIFSEFAREGDEPVWSLRSDWYNTYMECADPTEYTAAMALIGNWEHYTLIRNHPKIKPIMDSWAKELEVKIRSGALLDMMRHAKSPNGASAAKWIAEGGFAEKVLKSKEAKKQEEAIKDEMASRVADDMERLGLKLVSGGK